MTARPSYEAHLRLPLVTWSVALYPATGEADTVRFNTLNPEPNNHNRTQTLNAGTGEPLNRSDPVKGSAIAKSQYVVLFDSEDFETVWGWLTSMPEVAAALILCFITALLAFVTVRLYRATARLARDGKKFRDKALAASAEATNLAREEVNATHCPKIRVKRLSLTEDLSAGKAISVNLWLVNCGSANATLQQVGIRFALASADQTIPFDPSINAIVNASHELSAGFHLPFPPITDGTILSDEQVGAIQNGKSKLYCVGHVSYWDPAKRLRITGFRRVLTFPQSRPLRRFSRFEESDYEYEG
jgi:hypothetical protein